MVSAGAAPVTAGPRAWRGRAILRAAVPAALIAAAVGLALPRVASYGAAWASSAPLTWPYALLIGLLLVTAVLGQLISNTATALVVIPIALSAAAAFGVSGKPFLMAVNVVAGTLAVVASRVMFAGTVITGGVVSGPAATVTWKLPSTVLPA